MKGATRISLGARKKSKKKKISQIRSIVAYLKSDAYLFAPLFSNSESLNAGDVSFAGLDALGTERVDKKKRRMSEKVKEYLKPDYHMYGPMISPMKPGSSLKGEVHITSFVTMEISTSTTNIREDNNNYRNVGSEGRRTRLNREGDLSPAFSSQSEGKMLKLRSNQSCN